MHFDIDSVIDSSIKTIKSVLYCTENAFSLSQLNVVQSRSPCLALEKFSSQLPQRQHCTGRTRQQRILCGLALISSTKCRARQPPPNSHVWSLCVDSEKLPASFWLYRVPWSEYAPLAFRNPISQARLPTDQDPEVFFMLERRHCFFLKAMSAFQHINGCSRKHCYASRKANTENVR